jgi:hypothetical protein
MNSGKKISPMVFVPDSIADGCSKIYNSLEKLQPKLMMVTGNVVALDYLSKLYHGQKSIVESCLGKLMKASSSCRVCDGKLGKSVSMVLSVSYDFEELTCAPRAISALCEKCEKVSNFSKMMELYMKESLMDVSENSELSVLIEHFLKVNGYKLSEVGVFNGVLSLNASLKKSIESLDIEHVSGEPSVESLISRLVSSNSV